MKRFFIYILSFAFCALSLTEIKAQALIAEEVTIQRQMDAVEAVALRRMLLNEANTVPSADMYPEWTNTKVHFNHALPDSFRIDLRGFVMPTTNTKITIFSRYC